MLYIVSRASRVRLTQVESLIFAGRYRDDDFPFRVVREV